MYSGISTSKRGFDIPAFTKYPLITNADSSAIEVSFVMIVFKIWKYSEWKLYAAGIKLTSMSVKIEEKTIKSLACPKPKLWLN
jgi:hypothetical protein